MVKHPKLLKTTFSIERRYDRFGGMRLMTEAEGYVMMRRVGRKPCLITRKEWDSLSRVPIALDETMSGENV